MVAGSLLVGGACGGWRIGGYARIMRAFRGSGGFRCRGICHNVQLQPKPPTKRHARCPFWIVARARGLVSN